MSTFLPGTGGDLKSVTQPAALFELARLLDAQERLKNGANPGIAPKKNVSVVADFGEGVCAVTAELPIAITLDATGKPIFDATDYLGLNYGEFVPGTGGTLKSTDVPSAFLELAQLVANAENLIPEADRPENVSITYDADTLVASVSCNLPITTAADSNGAVLVQAVDYLP
jgi:hypothetical protein